MILSKDLTNEQAKDIVRKADSALLKARAPYPELYLYQDKEGYYHVLSAHDYQGSTGKRGWKRLNPYGGEAS